MLAALYKLHIKVHILAFLRGITSSNAEEQDTNTGSPVQGSKEKF